VRHGLARRRRTNPTSIGAPGALRAPSSGECKAMAEHPIEQGVVDALVSETELDRA
jgi:hypothetical protein